MSDTFDHWEDAYNNSWAMDADGYDGSNMEYDPLYYHTLCREIEVTQKTEKAYLIKFKNGSECWVAKKLCESLTDDSVYIWSKAILTPIKNENIAEMFDELPDDVPDEKEYYGDGSLIEPLPF